MFISLMILFLTVSFIFVSWYFYVEDRFLFKVRNLIVSNERLKVRGGDILRLGIMSNSAVASHWVGRPLHHYVLLVNIEGVLYVAHTWYKKIKRETIIHIPPSYQLQPLEDYIISSPMSLVEVFSTSTEEKIFSLESITNYFKNFGNSVRCYITIMNLLDALYPELKINYSFYGHKNLRNFCLWSFFFFKPMWFEEAIIRGGFIQQPLMKLENIYA